MYININFELNKYDNTFSFNIIFDILGLSFSKRFSKFLKHEYPQYLETVDLIKNLNSDDLVSIDSESLIESCKDLKPRWYFYFLFNYIELLFPKKYNWISYELLLISFDIKEIKEIGLAILGLGFIITKY